MVQRRALSTIRAGNGVQLTLKFGSVGRENIPPPARATDVPSRHTYRPPYGPNQPAASGNCSLATLLMALNTSTARRPQTARLWPPLQSHLFRILAAQLNFRHWRRPRQTAALYVRPRPHSQMSDRLQKYRFSRFLRTHQIPIKGRTRTAQRIFHISIQQIPRRGIRLQLCQRLLALRETP